MTIDNASQPFWQRKTLKEMTLQEWERLCDRCGRCCLHKLEDEEDGEVYYTAVGCRLLDTQTGHCLNYKKRKQLVPGCTVLTLQRVDEFHWLPQTCAYRLLSENKPLYDWHPLLSGTFSSVHEAGISIHGWVHSEKEVPEDEWEDHIIPHEMIS